MLEHTVDGLGLGFGQEADAAQVDAQHRNVGVARKLGGPRKGAVAAETDDQFASLGGVGVGVDDLDVDAQRAHIVRSQLRRAAIDRFSGQHAKANVVVVQHFLYPTSSLGRFRASGVHHQQHSTFKRHFGPASIASRTSTFQLISRQTPIGFGAQPQEVFNVARWARERARRDPDGVPTELAGATRDGEHGTRP